MNAPSKALRYGTRSQGISQFYLHTPRSSANGMNHTCVRLLAFAAISILLASSARNSPVMKAAASGMTGGVFGH